MKQIIEPGHSNDFKHVKYVKLALRMINGNHMAKRIAGDDVTGMMKTMHLVRLGDKKNLFHLVQPDQKRLKSEENAKWKVEADING